MDVNCFCFDNIIMSIVGIVSIWYLYILNYYNIFINLINYILLEIYG